MPQYKNTDDQSSKVKLDSESAHFKTVQPGETVNLSEEHGENLGWEKVKGTEDKEQGNGEGQVEEDSRPARGQDFEKGEADEQEAVDSTGDEGAEGESEAEQEERDEVKKFDSWSETLLNLNVDESTEAIDQALEEADPSDHAELLEDALEAEENGQDRKSVKSYIESELNNLEEQG